MTELTIIEKKTLDRISRWNLAQRRIVFNVAMLLAMGLVAGLVLAGGKQSSQAWMFGLLLIGFMGIVAMMGNQVLILAGIVQKRSGTTG